MANIIQFANLRFCENFVTRAIDPTGRQYDQMTQAARSGKVNIVEGSARASTSKETEMRLTDVARASLAELHSDYEDWLMRKGLAPWHKDSADAQAVYAMRLDKPEYGKDVVHDSCSHVLAQQKKFSQWLESENPEVYANAMLILLSRTINMLLRQLEAQGDNFAQEGGFREKLTAVRTEARAKQEDAPVCPECGRPMRKRRAKAGTNAGHEFWGCTGYPACTGIREL